jgi:hypothetical protein
MGTAFPADETFDFSGGIGDIGGDDLDLRTLDMTDTLIGSAMSELSEALGSPLTNEYEAYHRGDGGLSDITLSTFDSALLMDGGIMPYREDTGREGTFDEAEELRSIAGADIRKEPPKETKKVISIMSILEKLDREAAIELKEERLPWIDSTVFDNDLKVIDDENDFTDKDFDDSETFEGELQYLVERANNGDFDYIFKRKTRTLLPDSGPNIRLVK